jgi:hypothetical protein
MFTVPAAIDRAGAPPLQPPTYVGPITLGDLTVDELMTPYDFSTHFSSGAAVDSYSISTTPSGLSFNTNTGVLSGTPDTIANTTGVTVTATNAAGSTPTDAFAINVIEAQVGYGNDLVFEWETTTDSQTLDLPGRFNGTYSFDVDWGDTQTQTGLTDGQTSHTYATAGTYLVRISGTYSKIYFNATPEVANLRAVYQLGDVGYNDESSGLNLAFYNCRDVHTFHAKTGTTNETQPVVSMDDTFVSCWRNPISPDIDLSGLKTDSCTGFKNMFSFSDGVIKGTENFVIANLTDASSMFSSSEFAQTEYDLLLIGWAAQAPAIQSDVSFHAGTATYSAGAAADARLVLTGTYNWTITDGGPA